jgi:3-(3-hydroxy-phenyl)propionate hydroxylase
MDQKLCLNDLLRWANGDLLLLLFGDLTATDLKRVLQLTPHAPLRAVQVIAAKDTAQAVEHVRDTQEHLRQACHASQARWALVRPDAYVAATGSELDGRWIQAVGKALAMAD